MTLVSYSQQGLQPGQASGIDPWIVGSYYTNGSGTTGTTNQTGDRLVAVKLDVPPGGKIDRIGIEVTTQGTGSEVVRLGIAKATTGFTTGLLLDAGTVAVTSAGIREITVSYTFPGPGAYYLLCDTQALTTTVGLRTIAGVNTKYANASSTSTIAQCYVLDGVTGAFSASFTLVGANATAAAVKVRAA